MQALSSCWHTPLMPTLGRQRQENLCGSEYTLVYIVRSSQSYIARPCPVGVDGVPFTSPSKFKKPIANVL